MSFVFLLISVVTLTCFYIHSYMIFKWPLCYFHCSPLLLPFSSPQKSLFSVSYFLSLFPFFSSRCPSLLLFSRSINHSFPSFFQFLSSTQLFLAYLSLSWIISQLSSTFSTHPSLFFRFHKSLILFCLFFFSFFLSPTLLFLATLFTPPWLKWPFHYLQLSHSLSLLPLDSLSTSLSLFIHPHPYLSPTLASPFTFTSRCYTKEIGIKEEKGRRENERRKEH